MNAPTTGQPTPVFLSAPTSALLAEHCARLAEHLRGAGTPVADVAATLARRQALPARVAVVASTTDELVRELADVSVPVDGTVDVPADGAGRIGEVSARPRLAFAFTGQASQYAGMGAALAAVPVVADWYREAAELLSAYGVDLDAIIGAGDPAGQLASTRAAAPAVHAVQIGLLRLFGEWGARPDLVMGHSLGEYAAAVAAGALTAADSLRLVAERSRLMADETPPGAMAALRVAPRDAALLLAEHPGLDVAAVNAEREIVLSGPVDEVDRLLDATKGSRLAVSHAFHSRAMSAIQPPFAAAVAACEFRPPSIPFLRVTPDGDPIDPRRPVEPDYLVRHLTGTVRYDRLIALLRADVDANGPLHVLEIGPQPALTRHHLGAGLDAHWTLDRARPALRAVLEAFGRLWASGVTDAPVPVPAGRRTHLPVTPLSTPDQSRPAAEAAPTPALAPAPVPRPAPVEPVSARAALAHAWQAVTGSSPRPGVGLLSAGADSLGVLSLRRRLADHWPVVPDIEALMADPTAEQLLAALDAARPVAPSGPAVAAAAGAGLVSRVQADILTAGAIGRDQENVLLDVEIAAPLDGDALRLAWSDIQHEVALLRTRFSHGAAGWRADVSGEPLSELAVATALDPGDLAAAAAAELAALGRPLPADRPVAAAAVLGGSASRLVLACHHAVSDATTMGLLLRRLGRAYERRVGAVASPVDTPDLDDRFGGLVAAGVLPTASSTVEPTAESTVEYGASVRPRLRIDRGPDRRGVAREIVRTLDPADAERLHALCRDRGATIASAVLAAVAGAVHGFEPGRDVAIGVPVDIRHTLAEPDTCGPLLAVETLTVPWQADRTLAELLAAAREELASALARAGTPDRTRQGAFDVMVSLPHVGGPAAFAGHPVTVRDLPTTHAKYPVTVSLQSGAVTRLAVEYDSGRVRPRVAEAFADTVLRVLRAAGSDVTAPVRAAVAEAPRPVRGAPGPVVPDLTDVLDRLLDTVAAKGNRPALRVADAVGTTVSGADLATRIRAAASGLRSRGIGHDDLVAVSLPVGVELVTTLLAVLVAGAGYLPLDPDAPPVRHRRILASTRPALVLDGATADLVAGGRGAEPVTRPLPAPAGALAYAISTSGSTGTPKNVEVSRRALAQYLEWACAAYLPHAPGGGQLVSSPAVDLSVTALFVPLFGAGTLWLPDGTVPGDTVLRAAAAAEPDGLLKATPAHLEFLLGSTEDGTSLPWSTLVVGGEPLRASVVHDLRRRRPDVRVVNEYGPTEATVGCIAHTVDTGADPDAHHSDDQVPIGQPIPGCTVRVLDDRGRQVPHGAVGQLHLGGPGLARGYRFDPRATAAAFVPDHGGARLYRTGDLVWWDGDALRYLGRINGDQVKIRGHRVQLGEVAAAVRQLPGVSAVVVDVDRDAAGTVRALHARVVGTAPDDALQRLARVLPAPAVPTTITSVDSLPMTAAGKRKHEKPAEPVAPVGPASAGTASGGFATEAQRVVAAVWARVLERPVAAADDDFFRLGGHSLTVLTAMVALREEFPAVQAQDFFAHRTVAALAAHLAGDGVPGAATESAGEVVAEVAGEIVGEAAGEVPAGPVSVPRLVARPRVEPRPRTAGRLGTVVVTGAAGLLGSAVTAHLAAGGHDVVALARGRGHDSAAQRVRAAIRSAGLAEDTAAAVRIVDADLAAPDLAHRLGGDLGAGRGVVVHTAADIRHFGDRAEFAATNVAGSHAIASWAAGNGLELVHISSSGLADLDHLGDDERAEHLTNPYVWSKWEGERAIRELADRDGLRARIIRVGSLVGDSRTGRFPQEPERNRVYRALHAVVTAGAAPSTHRWGLDLLPLDSAAADVSALCMLPATGTPEVLHLVNPHELSFTRLAAILRGLGYPVADSDFESIVDRLRHDETRAGQTALATFVSWFGEPDAPPLRPEQGPVGRLLPDRRVPEPELGLLGVLVGEMVRVGFLPPPRGAAIISPWLKEVS